MYKNSVWEIIKVPEELIDELNMVDSKWVFKTKNDENGKINYKARLVSRGYLDKNFYDLSETYAPVSRLPLVRLVFAIINKQNFQVCQLDVKTAFLNGELDKEIFMDIPEGVNIKRSKIKGYVKVCKLIESLYGLKISPKCWNDKLTEVTRKLGLKNSDLEPCLFIWREGNRIVIVLLYVDDIIIAGNCIIKMKLKLN